MTAEEHRERSCGKKRRFVSSSDARRSHRRIRSMLGGEALEPYRCVYCGFFHMGHGKRAKA